MSDCPSLPCRKMDSSNRLPRLLPITRQLDEFCLLMGEGAYCEYCKRFSCRNTDFYESYICSTEQTYWLKEHNEEYLSILSDPNTDALSRSEDISPDKYAREIRFKLYQEYATFYELPWTKRKENPLPNCLTSMVRLLIRAPAHNVLDWIRNPMMYDIHNTSVGCVMVLTNELSWRDMDILVDSNKKQKTDDSTDLV